MTRSITDPTAPTRPVLRRLADFLAAQPGLPTDTPDRDTGGTRPASGPPRGTDPAAPAMADRVLRAAVEIMCGRRPVEQLAAVLRPDQLRYLVGLRGAARLLRPNIQSVRSQQPAPGVLEATGVVVLRSGVRAMSARFEVHVTTGGARWQCTALHLPLTRGDVTAARRLK